MWRFRGKRHVILIKRHVFPPSRIYMQIHKHTKSVYTLNNSCFLGHIRDNSNKFWCGDSEENVTWSLSSVALFPRVVFMCLVSIYVIIQINSNVEMRGKTSRNPYQESRFSPSGFYIQILAVNYLWFTVNSQWITNNCLWINYLWITVNYQWLTNKYLWITVNSL